MMTSNMTASGIFRTLANRKDILTAKGPGGIWILPFQGKREVDFSIAFGEIFLMDDTHPLNLTPQRLHHWPRQHGNPILAAFAIAHQNLSPVELDVMHPQAQTFKQPQSGAVEQACHQPLLAGETFEQPHCFICGENHRQTTRLFRPRDTVEPEQFPVQHHPIEKKQRTERLILRGRGHIPVNGKMRKKCLDFPLAHLIRMAFVVKQNKPTHPVDISLFSANTVSLGPNSRPYTVEQTRLLAHRRSSFTSSV
jgi:hypothetical protein